MTSIRSAVADLYRAHLGQGTARLADVLGLPVEVESEGAHVYDEEGRRYLQFGGYGVFILGHRYPAVVEALHRQLDRHPIATKTFLSRELAEAAERLVSVTPDGLERVYFGTGGAEVVETALKLARANGRRRVLAMRGGFHGKSLGALSVTDRPSLQMPFHPLLPGVETIDFGDEAALSEALAAGEPAAVIVEPVQGEGGVHLPPPGYLSAVSALCRDHGAILIADEIQSGLGRLGTWWGWDEAATGPDILLVGKALGGGCVPVSAAVCTAEAFRPIDRNPRLHSGTFSGYPLGMAAATATLRALQEEDHIARAATLGERLLGIVTEAMKDVPSEVVREVRGRGLLLGIEFTSPRHVKTFMVELLEHRVIATTTVGKDTVIRFSPPAVISDDDIAQFRSAVESAARAVAEV
ncbi:aminotransferase class III-fold pyridoxal phosphate-dependent enzyme [Streptomyces sp. NBC_01275]|uniref:aspartate aminotransferase family protein n=1 Tax=Streptomyces sp. NBC_01275 TaxID=2903807 RepID=UPI0022553E96|nr:aminotransferase class III-fold pyridoxal phosphate-dependent enzyme [Streptomyces sp. NBC_01275]MCX4763973.1 aminotransferase class III-fold pyridoxal phosphate-dependent enzyme [Streptomyces sp. NBC_01275]